MGSQGVNIMRGCVPVTVDKIDAKGKLKVAYKFVESGSLEEVSIFINVRTCKIEFFCRMFMTLYCLQQVMCSHGYHYCDSGC